MYDKSLSRDCFRSSENTFWFAKGFAFSRETFQIGTYETLARGNNFGNPSDSTTGFRRTPYADALSYCDGQNKEIAAPLNLDVFFDTKIPENMQISRFWTGFTRCELGLNGLSDWFCVESKHFMMFVPHEWIEDKGGLCLDYNSQNSYGNLAKFSFTQCDNIKYSWCEQTTLGSQPCPNRANVPSYSSLVEMSDGGREFDGYGYFFSRGECPPFLTSEANKVTDTDLSDFKGETTFDNVKTAFSRATDGSNGNQGVLFTTDPEGDPDNCKLFYIHSGTLVGIRIRSLIMNLRS